MERPDGSDYDYLFKIALLGDGRVGKSSLMCRYVDNKFNPTYDSTRGADFRVKTLRIDDKDVKLQIWDTCGQERFRAITRTYYRGAHGIILVYDLTCQESFDNLRTWIKDVKEHAPAEVNMLLVGNKADLTNERVVEGGAVKDLARELGIPCLETSCKEHSNVDEAFSIMAKAIKDRVAAAGPGFLGRGSNTSKPTRHGDGRSVVPAAIERLPAKRSGCC